MCSEPITKSKLYFSSRRFDSSGARVRLTELDSVEYLEPSGVFIAHSRHRAADLVGGIRWVDAVEYVVNVAVVRRGAIVLSLCFIASSAIRSGQREPVLVAVERKFGVYVQIAPGQPFPGGLY